MVTCSSILPKRFCFCLSLDSGALFIGWVGVIYCFVQVWTLQHFFLSVQYEEMPYLFFYYSLTGTLNLVTLGAFVYLIIASKTGQSLYIMPWLIIVPFYMVLIISIMCDRRSDRIFVPIGSVISCVVVYIWLSMLNFYLQSRNQEKKIKEQKSQKHCFLNCEHHRTYKTPCTNAQLARERV